MKLAVSEVFYSMQGEGITAGNPSVFVRLTGCNLMCGGKGTEKDGQLHNGATWRCDTIEVWQTGTKKEFEDVLDSQQLEALKAGVSMILTGGEPMLQQKAIVGFVSFVQQFTGCFPVEIETNGTVAPSGDLLALNPMFNCSPKLSNSGMNTGQRLKPQVIDQIKSCNHQFKFVIANSQDWEEIENDWLPLIKKKNIVLMPAGENQEELRENREEVASIALQNGVKYCDRLHVVIWNEKTGV